MSPSLQDALDMAGDSLERAASLLWHLDTNRLKPGAEYELDIQAEAAPDVYRVQPRRLFRAWRDDVWTRPTFARFRALLAKHDSRDVPVYTSDEDLAFILAIADTPLMRFVRSWLLRTGRLHARTLTDFVPHLFAVWFRPNVGNNRNSTGFQHVFCGDLKKNTLSGLHNFVRVFLEEQEGHLSYMGFVDKHRVDGGRPTPNQPIFGVRFSLFGCRKTVSTMFFGVSPEFEVGLYTLLFFCKCTQLDINLGRSRARIKVFMERGKVRVAYPMLLRANLDNTIVSVDGLSGGTQHLPMSIPRPLPRKRKRTNGFETHNSGSPKTRLRTAAEETANEVIDLTRVSFRKEGVVDLTGTDSPQDPRVIAAAIDVDAAEQADSDVIVII